MFPETKNSWTGEAGTIYFAQTSANLVNWNYLPSMSQGPAPHQITHDTLQPRFFMRLKSYQDPAVTGLEVAKNADADQDGISNF